jgi:hypothetical protein
MRPRLFPPVLLPLLLPAASPLAAQDPPLTRAQEIALAESAAPPEIAAGAAVWILGLAGYEKVREASNGFACLVERSVPRALEPICYDAEGAATILPATLETANLRAAGLDTMAIRATIAEGYRSGRLRAPARTGVAYMLSAGTRFVDPATGAVVAGGPHLMFYAPYLRDAEIGGLGETHAAGRHLPFVIAEGSPTAYIVVMLPAGAARTPAEARQ